MPDESWVDYFRRMVTPRIPQAPPMAPVNIPRTWQDIGSNLQKSGIPDVARGLYNDPIGTLTGGVKNWWDQTNLPGQVMQKASIPSDIAARSLGGYIDDPTKTPLGAVTSAVKGTDFDAPVENLSPGIGTELTKRGVLGHGDPISNTVAEYGLNAFGDPTNPIPVGPVLEGAQLAALPAWKLKQLKGLKQFAHGTTEELPEASKMVEEGFDLTIPGADIDLLNRHMHSAGVTPAQYDEAIKAKKTPGVGTYASEFGKRKIPLDFADPNAMVMNLTNPIPPEDVNAAVALLDPVLDKDKIRSIKARARKQYKYLPPREPEFPPETEAPKIAGLLPEKAGWGDPKYPVPDYKPVGGAKSLEVARKAAVKDLEDTLIQGNVYGRGNVTGAKYHSTLNNPNIDELRVRDPKTGEYNPIAGIYYHDLGTHESLASVPSAMKAQDPGYWNPKTEWQPFKEKAGQTFPIDKPVKTAIPLGEEGKGGVMMGQPQAERYGQTWKELDPGTPVGAKPKYLQSITQNIAKQKTIQEGGPANLQQIKSIIEKHGLDPGNFIDDDFVKNWSPDKLQKEVANVLYHWTNNPQAAAASDEIIDTFISKAPKIAGSDSPMETHVKDIMDILEGHGLNTGPLTNVNLSTWKTPQALHKDMISYLEQLNNPKAKDAAYEINDLWEMKQGPPIEEPRPPVDKSWWKDDLFGSDIPTKTPNLKQKMQAATQDIHLNDIKKILDKNGLDSAGILENAVDLNLTPEQLHNDIAAYLSAGPLDEKVAAVQIKELWQKKAAMQGLVAPPKPGPDTGKMPIKMSGKTFEVPIEAPKSSSWKPGPLDPEWKHQAYENRNKPFSGYTPPPIKKKKGAPPTAEETKMAEWQKVWDEQDAAAKIEAPNKPFVHPLATTKIETTPGTFTKKDVDTSHKAGWGGSHEKEVYTKGGQDYLFKPSWGVKYAPDQELTANNVAKLAGLKVPEMSVETIGGKRGTMQSLFGNKGDWPSLRSPGQSIEKLSTADLQDIIRNQPVDWLTANHDAHQGQWLVTPTGIIEIDRGQAFKHFGEDSLSKDYNPNAKYGEDPSIYIAIHKLWKAGKLPQLSEKDITEATYGTTVALHKKWTEVMEHLSEGLQRAGKSDQITEASERFAKLQQSMNKFWTK